MVLLVSQHGYDGGAAAAKQSVGANMWLGVALWLGEVLERIIVE